jgi:exopolyphosphatase
MVRLNNSGDDDSLVRGGSSSDRSEPFLPTMHTNSTSITFASYLGAIPTYLSTNHFNSSSSKNKRGLVLGMNTENTSCDKQQDSIASEDLCRITIGNEAGDADSIISSLALSYIDNNKFTSVDVEVSRNTARIPDNTQKNIIHVPLVSIPREDFPLRRDVVLLLEMAGVNCEKLLFLRDEEITQIIENQNIRKEWTLVDHNKFRSDLLSADAIGDVMVVEILDHHQDEGAHPSVGNEQRNIAFDNQSALVGSTCTLVTERLMKRCVQEDTTLSCKVDAGLGLALLGVILLDTMNMSREAAKGTARDEAAIEFLLERTNWNALNVKNKELRETLFESDGDGGTVPSRSRLYEYLQNCKFDREFWLSMSPKDALRIDYKRFETKDPVGLVPASFGLSSVLLDMQTLLSKPSFVTECMAYMEEVNVTLLGVLAMTIVDDKPKREILLIGDKQRVYEMSDYLLHNDAALSLKISKAEEDLHLDLANDTVAAVHLKQGNPKGSRKQVAPVMLAGIGDQG